ncbi:MAG: hypothetical protein HC822_10500 [Oscillochloris sp.]|nr:hypothetical protein [Oscillochloris sp.]
MLVGTLTVLTTYLLMSRLAGRMFGLATAALLAAFHYHIHFSRLGSNQVADALFAGLALLFLFRGYDRRSPLFWTLSGVVLGASQFFYAGARFAAVLVAVVTLVLFLRDGRRFWREQWVGVALLAGALLISGAPMIQYALRFPDDYNARLNEVGIIQSGWLEREQEIRGQDALPILFDQFQRAVLAYNAYPDRTVWYGIPRPYFTLIPGTLFILGIGYAGLNLFNRRIFPLVAWWGGAILMGGMLTESPPSSQRLVTTAVPAMALLVLALMLIVQGLWRAIGSRGMQIPALALAAATVLIGFGSARYYFVEYTPLRVYGNMNAVVATELADYANRAVGPEGRLYFFGPPRMYVDFGTIPYLAPQVAGVSIVEPLARPPGPELVSADKDAVFVFLPEREGELAQVRQAYPDGDYTLVPSPIDGAPLFSVYTVPRDALVIRAP